jgi:hypothetical protein
VVREGRGEFFPATVSAPGGIYIGELAEDDDSRGVSLRRHRPNALPRKLEDTALVEAWGDLLAPFFGDGESCNFTGTYSDVYGYSHGCMLVRNVVKDFLAFRDHLGRSADAACIGVEFHPSGRAILHFHALMAGTWTDADIEAAQFEWTMFRGWAKAKRVADRDGCVRYAAKHLLKQGAADNFEFWRPAIYQSRRERRSAARIGAMAVEPSIRGYRRRKAAAQSC